VRRQLRGMLLLIAGMAMLLTAAGMLALQERQATVAGQNAEVLLEKITEQIAVKKEEVIYDTAVEEAPPAGEVPKATWQGYDMIGILRMPSLSMELPILQEWSYDLLELSPCRYSGSAEGGDLIILGHNYKKHFTPMKKLKVGDEVEFCDAQGTVYRYQVTKTEILKPAELDRLTGSEHDLTLFTCTGGGYKRHVVRCDRIPEEESVLR